MRRIAAGLVAASLLSSPVYAASCLRPAEHTALDIIALKTQLMVTALTCSADEKYNSFMMKYRPDVQREDKEMGSYFTRAYGRSGAKQRDDYVTQLANDKSQVGLRQGSLFCEQNIGAFDEVMALKSGELADYAAGRAGVQPINVSECGPGATPAAAHSSSARSTSHSTRRTRS